MSRQPSQSWITLVTASVRTPGTEARPYQKEWSPRADVYESPDHVIVAVELPGVLSRQVKVQYDPVDHGLIVRGHRVAQRGSGLVAHQIEIEDGAFERFVSLPPVELDIMRSESKWSAGVLMLALPKVPLGIAGVIVETLAKQRN